MSGSDSISSVLWRFGIVCLVCSMLLYDYWVLKEPEWPSCTDADRRAFHSQLEDYATRNFTGHMELRGECAFSRSYDEATSTFAHTVVGLRHLFVKQNSSVLEGPAGLSFKGHEAQQLKTQYAILRGSKEKFLISLSGTHGVEGYAGSGVQETILQYMHNNPEFRKLYTDLESIRENHYKKEKARVQREKQQQQQADDEGSPSKPITPARPFDESTALPTVLFVHIQNPYGMKNNRRVNEDNIDINRNYLTDEEFSFVKKRDPNFAHYVDFDFIFNPVRLPTSSLFLNDMYGHLMSVYGIAIYGFTTLKRALLAGNYYKPNGIGYGGFERSTTVKNLITIMEEKLQMRGAKQVSLLDLHTGLGVEGTDTLALLAREAGSFSDTLEKIHPSEIDGSFKAGNKVLGASSTKGGDAMDGYDLTMGTVDNFCKEWIHKKYMVPGSPLPLCITQEFGTVPAIMVGKATVDENFAANHGSTIDKTIYGKRMRDVFFIKKRSWMRSIAHRGLTVFLEAWDNVNQSVA